jgi:hypothetical protein
MSLFADAELETLAPEPKEKAPSFKMPRLHGPRELVNGAVTFRSRHIAECRRIIKRREQAAEKWRNGCAAGDTERLEALEMEVGTMRGNLERTLTQETDAEYWLSLRNQAIDAETWLKGGAR